MNPPPTEFRNDVVNLIEAYLSTGKCSAMAIARDLGVDYSTLNRRLARAGHCYLHLLQVTRKKRFAQLSLTAQPLRAIAPQLGFAHANSFSRWLIDTFGFTVRRWRKSK